MYVINNLRLSGNIATAEGIYISVMLPAFFTFCLGLTFGSYMSINSPLHKVVIDEKQNFRTILGARIVLFTSHHVVLLISHTIVTFPTDAVREIAADTQP
jgi:hypothetical protein